MSKQIAVRVLRTVAVSDDGIRTRTISKGTRDTVPGGTFEGLEKEGYVERIEGAPEIEAPASEPATTAPAGGGAGGPVAETVDLPTGDNTKAEIDAFAAAHGIDISTARKKEDALALIAAALKAKAD